MQLKPRFVTAKDAIAFNKRAVAGTGESYCLLNDGALKNAIAKPINRFEYNSDTDVCSLATATIFGLAKAHAFEQGNKRTAFVSGLYFIERNGFGYHGSINGMNLGLKIIELCENNASEEELIDFLRYKFIYRVTTKGRLVPASSPAFYAKK